MLTATLTFPYWMDIVFSRNMTKELKLLSRNSLVSAFDKMPFLVVYLLQLMMKHSSRNNISAASNFFSSVIDAVHVSNVYVNIGIT